MEILNALKQAVTSCIEVLKWGSGIQENTRKTLITDLQSICSNCDAAYDTVLTRLIPIKNAYMDVTKLASELRAFAADSATRNNFKPEHLCGQVDDLLMRLGSNLDPLKYSIDYRRITDLRKSLNRFGNVDGAIYQSYDEFGAELDRIATQIQDPRFDCQERSRYVQYVIAGFESELRSAQMAMREAKKLAVGS